MRQFIFTLSLLFPLATPAATGAWQASGRGVALSHRGVAASSAPLRAAETINGHITLVYWRYTISEPIPAGLQVQLCAGSRCTAIEGGSGATRGLANVSASEALRFIYTVPGQGGLFPPLRVGRNEVMVNYQ
ncbi:Flagellar protein FlhE [Paramixta manurensis]|uniref:Flagellar protein FlhE n=1 Tax=Paramixta manurensis TaxID=2740817 RepID=A0A6M8U9U4_9GAMM|nr:Flagellar protein FlhE [Erwiniaceae bacterium PD-1]